MANTIIALISLLALALSSYMSLKNKTQYEKEITDRQAAESLLDKNKAHLKSLEGDLDETTKNRESVEKAVLDLKEQESAQKIKVAGIEKTKTDKQTKVDSQQKQISAVEDQLKDVGEISEIADKMRRLKEETDSLTSEKAAAESQLASLVSTKGSLDKTIEVARTHSQNFTSKQSFFSATSISSIFPTFGFVTLPIGGSAGVVPGSDLNVLREGSVIAKLRVRSVEAGRAAAEIIPDSVAADTTLAVGDRVVPGSSK
jgi:hypothetical protein